MSEYTFRFWSVVQTLDDRFALAEAIAAPEVSRLESAASRAVERLAVNLSALLEKAPLASLHLRHIAASPVVARVEVGLEPGSRNPLWREPLPLSFDLLRWRHGTGAEIAEIPVLGIDVLAADAQELDARLPYEIRTALTRLQAAGSLRSLVALQRVTKTTVAPLPVPAPIRSARQRARDAAREQQDQPSVLKRVATDLGRDLAEPAFRIDAVVSQLAELLTSRQPRSVLLVGPPGVGKTAAVRELVRRRADYGLAATPFWATSGARLVAGMSGFGMWQERCRDVVREASRRRAILHLGNLIELMQVGKSECQNTGIAAFLRPLLGRGELLAIAECAPDQIPIVEREDPHLLDVFQRVVVEEPGEADSRAILRSVADAARRPGEPVLTDAALATLDRLHRRYAAYSAYPGRPLRFLKNLLRDNPGKREIASSDIQAAFQHETGLPRVLLDPTERLDLARTRQWFAERVLGQDEPIDLVVDLLAMTKALLNRPRKPIASLLFIGPTGVGKTEMAKALAEYLFGSQERLTRFDMSEYGDEIAVRRLVGGLDGSEGLLTARVREQPFGVILLDEFEKAHPDFLNLLLQVMGEGRLTDAAGRLADFCNSVVILTSNLGAESYQRGAFGYAGAVGRAERDRAREHFTQAVQAHVRPELFNRVDRIVPFAPLPESVLHDIADRNLRLLELRDGVRFRGVTLEFGPGVAARLARKGYDVRYGARPLLRTLERELLAPLADQMNRYSAESALRARVELAGDGLDIHVRPRVDDKGRAIALGGPTALLEAAGECVSLRRNVQRLERSSAVRRFRNDLFRLQEEQKRYEKAQLRHAARLAKLNDSAGAAQPRPAAPRLRPEDAERMSQLVGLRALAERLRALDAESSALEDDALQALYADPGIEVLGPSEFTEVGRALRQRWFALLEEFFCRDFPQADRATLALFGEDRDAVYELAQAYQDGARARGFEVEALRYRLPDARQAPTIAWDSLDFSADDQPSAQWVHDELVVAANARQPARVALTRERLADLGAARADGVHAVGLLLAIRGPAAFPRFSLEAGLHLLRLGGQPRPQSVLVDVGDPEPDAYLPPPGIARKGAIGQQKRRRLYDQPGRQIEDELLSVARLPWHNQPLAAILSDAIELLFQHGLESVLQE